MPSGKTHIKINWLALLLIDLLLVIFNQNINLKYLLLFNIYFVLTSYYISPDLDIDSSVYKRWGILRWVWYPYKEIMKHGNSSHSFIWGPISLISNLMIYAAMIVFIIASLDLLTGFEYTTFVLESGIIIVICVTLTVWVHIIADNLLNK